MEASKPHNSLYAICVGTPLLLLTGCGGGGSSDTITGQSGTQDGNFEIGIGSAALSWTPPTTNVDGTSITDLAGFKIYYGTSQGVYTETIDIPNPGLADYVIDNLPYNTYFFVITAYDNDGNESNFSNSTTKLIL